MKKLIFMLFTVGILNAQTTTTIVCEEADAKIYEDGMYRSEGTLDVKIKWKTCVTILIKKVGFLDRKLVLCNEPSKAKPNKKYTLSLEKDQSYEASAQVQYANVDVEIPTTKDESTSWKLATQIILSYFEITESMDPVTGYLRTAWIVQSYDSRLVRTRIIFKQASIDPLKYKVKICSETTEDLRAKANDDDKFAPWDRILRKYETIIDELQSRMQ